MIPIKNSLNISDLIHFFNVEKVDGNFESKMDKNVKIWNLKNTFLKIYFRKLKLGISYSQLKNRQLDSQKFCKKSAQKFHRAS